jgi:hypothetical protein
LNGFSLGLLRIMEKWDLRRLFHKEVTFHRTMLFHFQSMYRHLLLPLAVLCGLLGVPGCSSTPLPENAATTLPVQSPSALDTRYAALRANGGLVFRLEPSFSSVRIYAFRGGEARRFGHNHVLAAPTFTGYFSLPSLDLAGARFDLEFALDALELDNPAHRSALGESFATAISPALVESTRENMLGAFNLQADRFGLVRIGSIEIAGEAPKFASRIAVELHGQRRELWVPMTVRGLPASLTVEGALVLSQADFGIKPYAVLGGLLAVQDPLVLEFTLRGSPM